MRVDIYVSILFFATVDDGSANVDDTVICKAANNDDDGRTGLIVRFRSAASFCHTALGRDELAATDRLLSDCC
jgi:hypothetical protein